jgi:hypothetical protein
VRNLFKNKIWFLEVVIYKSKKQKYIEMKYLTLSSMLLIPIMFACNTPKKLYEEKAYDQVIQKLAPDICEGRIKAKNVNLVANAYHKANQADHERIQSLRASGKPEIWPEVYQRYSSMKGRNDALKCFSNNVKRSFGYTKLDLDEELIGSKNKAEQYLAAKAGLLLNTKEKSDAEEALNYISQLQRINPQNTNVQDMYFKAMLYTSDNILIQMDNERSMPIPADFEEQLLDFESTHADKTMAKIDTRNNKSTDYDLVINIRLQNKNITPDRIDAVTYKEKMNGKEAEISEKTQSKSLTIKGKIEYVDRQRRKVLFTSPFDITSNFKHNYATLKGNIEACSEQTKSLLNSRELPFPTDESMMIDAAKQLNTLLSTTLSK